MRSLLALILLVGSPAYAGWVIIEPDDYANGTPITSPYARVLDVLNFVEHPVFASVPGSIPYLPNDGNSVFNTRPIARFGLNSRDIEFGLLFDFVAPVDQVSVDVLNFMYGPGLFIDCLAFASDGAQVQCGGRENFSAVYGQTSTASLTFGNGITKLYLGGGDEISALYFDNLRFNVPEPGTLSTLVFGILLLMLCRKRSIMR